MQKYFAIIIFTNAVFISALSQNIDSLKKILPSLRDSARIDCLLKISFEYGHVNNDSDNLFSPVNSDSATFYSSCALCEARKIYYIQGMANAFENLGEMAFQYNYHEGETYFKQAVLLYEQINDPENLNWAYLWLGWYLMNECRFNDAIQEYEKALPYYQAMNNDARQARTYGLLGRSYIMQGYYMKAYEYCLKDITITQKKMRYKNDPIYMYIRLGMLYQTAGDTAAALEYYRQSNLYSKEYNKTLYYKTRGDMNFLQNNYDSALYYYKLNDSTDNNGDIGKIYFLKKEYAKALPCFLKSLTKAKRKNDLYNVMLLLDNIAKEYEYQKKFELSLKYTTELRETATSTHARQFIRDGDWLSWKIYDQAKKMDSAYKYRLQFDNINDSILKDELSRNMAVTKMKFDDEQKQSQIDLLHKDNEIEQQQVRSESLQKNILIAGMIITVLIGFIVLRTFALKRKNEKLLNQRTQDKLKHQATELEMQALRAQMNPHFIFNCLSSINRFVLKNKTEEASDYLTKFSRLIRMVLNNSKRAYISLEEELETLQLYLDMERLRFKDSFDYSFTYNNSVEASNIFIPPLLLQPFAENAIWHGLMHKREKGFLNFNFIGEEKLLNCIITDNGVGREQAEILKSKSAEKQKSMGLKITRERLSLLNNSSNEKTFFIIEDIRDEDENVLGTRVHLKIYYKEMTEV